MPFRGLLWLTMVSLPIPLSAQTAGSLDPRAARESSPPIVDRNTLYAHAADVFRSVEQDKRSEPAKALQKLAELESTVQSVAEKNETLANFAKNIVVAIDERQREIARDWPTVAELEKQITANPDDAASVDDYGEKLIRELDRQHQLAKYPFKSAPTCLAELATASRQVEDRQAVLYRVRGRAISAAAIASLAKVDEALARQKRKLAATKSVIEKLGKEYPFNPPPALSLSERIDRVFAVEAPSQAALEAKLRLHQIGGEPTLIIAANGETFLARSLVGLVYDSQLGYALLAANCRTGEALQASRTFLEKLKIPLPDEGDATIAIIDPEGKTIAKTSASAISTAGKIDHAKFTEFLTKNGPSKIDGEKLLAAALEQARQSGKRVFVTVGGPGCAPCVRLARYLHEHRSLLEQDFVLAKFDLGRLDSPSVLKKLGYPKDSGIPWSVILDDTGKPLISSVGPEGNIGLPRAEYDEEIDYFRTMLTSTARRIASSEIDRIVDQLRAKDARP